MEKFYPADGNLFGKADTQTLREALKKQIFDKIKSLSDDYILNVSEDEYITYLKQDFHLFCPEIKYSEAYMDPRKVLVDPEYLPRYWGAESSIEMTVIRVFWPFDGDAEMLYFRPSTFTLSGWSNISIGTGVLYVDILNINDDKEEIKRSINNYSSTLKTMIGYLQNDYQSINRELSSFIEHTFCQIKNKIKQDASFISDIGLPIKNGADSSKTYAVPTVKRRFTEPKVSPNSSKSDQLSPVMDDSTYQQILESICLYGKNLEQYPNTTKDKGEEDIRSLFLSNLSSSFKSLSSTGESFNCSGKTDIMVKAGNDILFIAECKKWKGAQVYSQAITQLLGYLNWRNRKAALLIFVTGTKVSTVLNEIPATTVKHSYYSKTLPQQSPSWFKFKFKNPQDESLTIDLSVLVFNFQ